MEALVSLIQIRVLSVSVLENSSPTPSFGGILPSFYTFDDLLVTFYLPCLAYLHLVRLQALSPIFDIWNFLGFDLFLNKWFILENDSYPFKTSCTSIWCIWWLKVNQVSCTFQFIKIFYVFFLLINYKEGAGHSFPLSWLLSISFVLICHFSLHSLICIAL